MDRTCRERSRSLSGKGVALIGTLDRVENVERGHIEHLAVGGLEQIDGLIVQVRPVIDRATYEDATIPSAGIPFVIVTGQVVVDGGAVTSARPGRGIRAPLAAK